MDKSVKYEIKDSTRRYWQIVAHVTDDRAYDNPLLNRENASDADGFSTTWVYKVFFGVHNAKKLTYESIGASYCGDIEGQYDMVPNASEFILDFHHNVTYLLMSSLTDARKQ